MGTVIDSGVLIAAERQQLDLDALAAEHGEEMCMIASVSAAEILHGVHRASHAEQRIRRQIYVEALLAKFPVVAFDLRAARIHARIAAELAGAGVRVGAHDLLIAATALAREASIATRDERSFPRIPGVSVVRW